MSVAQLSPSVVAERDNAEALSALVSGTLERRWPRGSDLLDSICRYALIPAGKLFRPILLLEAALAVGGEVDPVLPAAAGAECGHVASLIHDDIIDGDDLRRGRPSVQHKYGLDEAIVAGDALLFDMFASLVECHRAGVAAARVVGALDAVARAGLDLCRGQSLEAEVSRSRRFESEAYLTVARLKTASFFRGACESGAILGGGSPESVKALATYGEQLGIAFQIHDDLLAYTSDTQTTGKRGTSDVQNGRLTLPVILAYERSEPSQRQLIMESLTSPADPEHALDVLGEVLLSTGAVAAAADVAREYATGSREAVASLPRTPSRDRLIWLADLVINRDH